MFRKRKTVKKKANVVRKGLKRIEDKYLIGLIQTIEGLMKEIQFLRIENEDLKDSIAILRSRLDVQ